VTWPHEEARPHPADEFGTLPIPDRARSIAASSGMSTSFHSMILGTRHNAVVLQAYLSRCGLKTLSVSVDRAEFPVVG
jgi:hypothetical protein